VRRGVLGIAAAFALAAPAAAAVDDWPSIKGARLDDRPPFAAFAVYRADASVVGVSLYLRAAGFAARRLSGEGEQWTTTERCPALLTALEALEDLPIPRIDAPGLGRTPRTAALALDGDSYFLWADGARWGGGAHAATLEVRGVEGSPLADWIEAAATASAGCWSAARP
jgi:hypothetical protein